MAKNIEINYNNGTSYDVLYPKTLASQVTAGTFSGAFTFDTSATFSKGATFTTIPSCSVTPTSTSHLANKSYVDSKVSSNSVSIPQYNVIMDAATVTCTSTGTTRVTFSVPTGYTIVAISVSNISDVSDTSAFYNPINVVWSDDGYNDEYSYFYKNTMNIVCAAYLPYASGSIVYLPSSSHSSGQIFRVIVFMRTSS